MRAKRGVFAFIALLLIAGMGAVVPGLAMSTAQAASSDGTLKIRVVREVNANGTVQDVLEPGWAGVKVKVTDSAGNSVELTTDANGVATLPPNASLVGGKYRVEAINPNPKVFSPAIASETFAVSSGDAGINTGAKIGSSVIFVNVANGASQSATTAFWNPNDYCQANPTIFGVCMPGPEEYFNALAPNESVFAANYRDPLRFDPQMKNRATGTVYGLGVDRVTKRVFAGAFAKRPGFYGPGGPGGIYVSDYSQGGSANSRLWATVPGADNPAWVNNNRDNGGWLPRSNNGGFRQVVAKEALGDLDVTDDGKFLLTINLYDRKLYVYDATKADGGAPLHVVDLKANNPCSNVSDYRPAAIGMKDGVLYIGGVCSAESSGNDSDLRSVISTYTMPTATSAPVFTKHIQSDPLNQLRGATNALGVCAIPQYHAWANSWPFICDVGPAGNTWAQPLMTDINFRNDGQLIVSYRDRTADQYGTTYQEVAAMAVPSGSVNLACKQADGSYKLDIAGGCGATLEQYWGLKALLVHNEPYYGGTVYVPTERNLVTSSVDPSILIAGVFASGISRPDAYTGVDIQATDQILATAQVYYSKGAGMGDLEALCDLAPIQIGNYVWADDDRDGIQDPNEAPLPGIKVELLNVSGAVIATTTTNAQGEYYFDSMTDGLKTNSDYTIRVTAPAGMSATTEDANNNGSDTIDSDGTQSGIYSIERITTGGPGENNHTYDFGFGKPKVSIGDYVWYDDNRDGQQSAGELPVAGVTVNLYKADGTTLVGTTTTDANGYYNFKDLDPSTQYVVEFKKPVDTIFTDANQGADATDSDANVNTGRVTITTPPSGSNQVGPNKADDPTIDAGLVRQIDLALAKQVTSAGPYKLGSTVTYKLTPRNNGPATAKAGWSVTDLIPTGMEITDIKGAASPSTYTCTHTADTGTCTSSVNLAANAEGEAIIVTAKITAEKAGYHNVAYVSPAPGEITETNPLVVPTRDTTNTATTPTNNDAQGDISLQPKVSIGDYVWYDTNRDGIQDATEKPVPNVTVNLYAADGTTLLKTTTTDAQGYYYFDNLDPSTNYVVEFKKPTDTVFTTQNAGTNDAKDSDADTTTGRVNVTTPATGNNQHGTGTPDEDDPTIDAGLIPPIDLTIKKTLNTAGPVHPGETVTFTLVPHNNGPSDAIKGWSVTEVLPTGLTLVSMTGVTAGDYTCSGVTCTSPTKGLAAGADGGAIKVVARVDANFRGTSLKNVTYVSPAPGEVVETNPLVVPTTNTDTSTSPTNNDDQAVVPVQPLVSVGDYVWYDTDRDGAQDANEKPVANVTVILYDKDGKELGRTVTDSNGYYAFTDLTPSTQYTIEFVKPNGYEFTQPNAAGDEIDSDANPTTGKVTFTTPATGNNSGEPGKADDPTIDAGLILPPVSIGDYVWYDDNRNGVQDATESPVPNVVVNLLDKAGNVVGTTATDASGYYYFDNLDPKTDYIVEFVKPANTVFTTQNAGGDDTKDSDADTTTGRVNVTTPASGKNNHGTGVNDEDDPTIDAGLVRQIDLTITKDVTSSGPYNVGSTVTYKLVPKNNGPANAIAGWSVTDLIPTGMKITAMSGTGYTCELTDAGATGTCTSSTGLAAGQSGNPITVTATITAEKAAYHNVTYISPAPEEVTETNPLVIPTRDTTDTVATPTNNDAQADVSLQPKVSIGDYVWYDDNRNGQQDASEQPVEGVVVQLKQGDTVVAETKTNVDGYYSFTNLTPNDNYTVVFVKPEGTVFTSQNTGDDKTDSDANPTTGEVAVKAPASGNNLGEPNKADNPTIDAGLVRKIDLALAKQVTSAGPYRLGSTVTYKLTPRNNGPADALGGWSVTDLAPTGIQITAMDGGANYETCSINSAGDTGTCVSKVGLKAGEVGAPITVTAKITAEHKTYHNVAYIKPAPGEVTETNPLVVPERDVTDTFTSPTNNDAQGDISLQPKVSVGDYVWYDDNRNGLQDSTEAPVKDVTVMLYDKDGNKVAETKTDSNGYYAFPNLIPNTEYTIEFVKPDGTKFTTPNAGLDTEDSDANPTTGKVTFTTPPNGSNLTEPGKADDPTIDAGLVKLKIDLALAKEVTSAGPYTIGSTVTYKLTPRNNGPDDAKAGWSVTDLAPTGIKITAMDGGASYEPCAVNLAGDTGTCVSKVGLKADEVGAPITVTAKITAEHAKYHNVAYIKPAAGEVPETNPLVVPERDTTDTATTPTNNDAQGDISLQPKVSIGDYVWYDENRDGLQGPTEAPVANVPVILYDKDGNKVAETVTDSNGYYAFTDLTPKTEYTVEFVKPKDTVFTTPNAGDDTKDSDANPTTGKVTFTTPETGNNSGEPGKADNPTIDAGLVPVKIDLAIVKTLSSQGTIRPGDTVTWTVVPQNNGPDNAKAGWSVVEVMPAGMSLVSMTGEGYDCTGNTCVAKAGLDSGAKGNPITVTTRVNANFTGTTLRNVTYVKPAEGETVETNPLVVPAPGTDTSTTPTNNDSHADVYVSPTPKPLIDLTIKKRSTTTGSIQPGGTVTYTLTPHNNGPGDAIAGWSVVEVMPSYLHLVEMTGAGYDCTANTCVAKDGLKATADGPVITVKATVDPNFTGTSVRNVTYVAPAPGEVEETNPLVVPNPDTDTDTTNTNNDSHVDIPLTPLPPKSIDLTIKKVSTTVGQIQPGGQVTYALTPFNNGPGDAIAGWSVTEVMPSYLKLVSMSGAGYTCNGNTCVAAAGLKANTAGAVINVVATIDPAYAGKTVRNVTYVSPAPGEVAETNPLVVPTPETDTDATDTNNDSHVDLPLTPLPEPLIDLTIVKRLQTTGTVYPGDNVTFTLTPFNNGPGNAKAGWSVTEILPAGLSLVSMSGNGYTCSGVTCTAGAGLAANTAGPVITVVAKIGENVTGLLHNVTYVAPAPGDVTETNPLVVPDTNTNTDTTNTNNDSQADVPVTPRPKIDLTIVKDLSSKGPFAPGATVEWKLTPHNNGPADAKAGWSVTEVLPNGLTLVSMSGAGYDCSGVTCVAKAGLAAGANGPVITVVAKIDPNFTGSSIRNVVFVAPTPGDVDETNPLGTPPAPNTDTDKTNTNNDAHNDVPVHKPEIDLAVVKKLATTTAVKPGDNVTFTLTPHNYGPDAAQAGWTVTEVLPVGLTMVSMSGTGYTCSGNTCVANAGLPAGTNGPVITVVAKVASNASGTLKNVVYVVPAKGDAAETNPMSPTPPTTSTNTTTTPTNNDSEASVPVVVPPAGGGGGKVVGNPPKGAGLPSTGSPVSPIMPALGLGLLLAGAAMIVGSRRKERRN